MLWLWHWKVIQLAGAHHWLHVFGEPSVKLLWVTKKLIQISALQSCFSRKPLKCILRLKDKGFYLELSSRLCRAYWDWEPSQGCWEGKKHRANGGAWKLCWNTQGDTQVSILKAVNMPPVFLFCFGSLWQPHQSLEVHLSAPYPDLDLDSCSRTNSYTRPQLLRFTLTLRMTINPDRLNLTFDPEAMVPNRLIKWPPGCGGGGIWWRSRAMRTSNWHKNNK